MTSIVSGSDYERYFNPEQWLQYVYLDSDRFPTGNDFILQQLHHIFSKGKDKRQRLLDIGTGPTIHTIISASNMVEEVYLSDYVDENIQILKAWLAGERSLQDDMIKRVCEMENRKQTIESRVAEMRKKVKNIFHIDITSLDSITGSDVPTKYDVITSSWCLDTAGHTKGKYNDCVKNISSLLKPGGSFVLIGDLNASFFKTDDIIYPLICLSSKDVKEIYESNGFDVIYWEECTYIDESGKSENPEITTFVMEAKNVCKYCKQ